MKRLIFLGPPGAGKGTYAQEIIKRYGIPQISTGDLLRQAVAQGTSLGKEAKGHMDKGGLVPDHLVLGMVRERLIQPDCKPGFLLDGFPRTMGQAESLDKILQELKIKLDAVVNIIVEDDVLMKRLTGRRVCKKCGINFNIYTRIPKKDGVCDQCGGVLFHREDDKPETIKNRLSVYKKQTQPLIDYYRKKGVLKDVKADAEISVVVERICSLLS